MSSPDTTPEPPAEATPRGRPDDRVDAIRYAVLRKLAPGMRHALMGELQAVQLSAEFASRMLRAGGDTGDVRDNVGRLPQQCSAAIKTGRAVIEWIRPEEGTIAVGECIARCLKLAGEDWFLRGIEATTDLSDADIPVAREMLQEMVVTALLVLTDQCAQPVDVHVAARKAEDHVSVVVRARSANRVASFVPMNVYRKLEWADLQLLASTHGVACACEGDTVSLRFPLDGAAKSSAR